MAVGDIYAAIDIGSTALRLICAVEQMDGTLEIQTMLSRPTQYITDGRVTDVERFTIELERLLKNINLSSVNIHYAHSSLLGTSNPNPTLLKIRGKVKSDDIIRGIEESADWLSKASSHREYYPNSFVIDNTYTTHNPIGEPASTLQIDYHLLTLDKGVVNDISLSMSSAGLEIVEHCTGVRSVAELLLSEQQKNHGVVVVDIGHELVTMIAYHKGNIVLSSAFSISGVSIEDAIMYHYNCSKPEAIALKEEYGFIDNKAKDEDMIISYTSADGERYFSTHDLSIVITKVYQRIFEMIIKKLKVYGVAYTTFRSGIMFVGGNAQIMHLRPYAIDVFKTPVRIGHVSEVLLGEKGISLNTKLSLNKLIGTHEYLHALSALAPPVDRGVVKAGGYQVSAQKTGKVKKLWNNLFTAS